MWFMNIVRKIWQMLPRKKQVIRNTDGDIISPELLKQIAGNFQSPLTQMMGSKTMITNIQKKVE